MTNPNTTCTKCLSPDDCSRLGCAALASRYEAPATPQAEPLAPVPYDKHEAEILAVIDERDRYHDMADQLATQIAAITGDEIGEHSSDNDPWRNAMLSADEWIARDLRAMFSGEPEPRSKVRLTQPTTVQQAETGEAKHYRDAAERALLALEVYMKLPSDRWPGPPTTAVLSLRAALKGMQPGERKDGEV